MQGRAALGAVAACPAVQRRMGPATGLPAARSSLIQMARAGSGGMSLPQCSTPLRPAGGRYLEPLHHLLNLGLVIHHVAGLGGRGLGVRLYLHPMLRPELRDVQCCCRVRHLRTSAPHAGSGTILHRWPPLSGNPCPGSSSQSWMNTAQTVRQVWRAAALARRSTRSCALQVQSRSGE